jgi:hypothetical protein
MTPADEARVIQRWHAHQRASQLTKDRGRSWNLWEGDAREQPHLPRRCCRDCLGHLGVFRVALTCQTGPYGTVHH